ncbi:MAG: ABC transporter permease [Gammaproteobacteria bacterium]
MIAYIIRRMLYSIPILIGVNLVTFLLFFVVNSPKDMAMVQLGDKYTTPEAVQQWIQTHGYDKPVFYNHDKKGVDAFTQTLFFDKSVKLFIFDFGSSDTGRDIKHDIKERMWPSFYVAVPSLLFGITTNILIALLLTLFRNSYLETWGVSACVVMLSISSLFYIILGQYFIGKVLQWVPVSGFETGPIAIKFIILPVLISVVAGIGSGARWYRSLLMEEVHKDYVRTAKAKGLSDIAILFKHVLQNAMIPILTGVVVLIPGLFLGSLLLESFFGIPGLGSYMIDAIRSQDFAIVRSMVYLGSVLYIIGLVLTDISYTWVDPRVRLS